MRAATFHTWHRYIRMGTRPYTYCRATVQTGYVPENSPYNTTRASADEDLSAGSLASFIEGDSGDSPPVPLARLTPSPPLARQRRVTSLAFSSSEGEAEAEAVETRAACPLTTLLSPEPCRAGRRPSRTNHGQTRGAASSSKPPSGAEPYHISSSSSGEEGSIRRAPRTRARRRIQQPSSSSEDTPHSRLRGRHASPPAKRRRRAPARILLSEEEEAVAEVIEEQTDRAEPIAGVHLNRGDIYDDGHSSASSSSSSSSPQRVTGLLRRAASSRQAPSPRASGRLARARVRRRKEQVGEGGLAGAMHD